MAEPTSADADGESDVGGGWRKSDVTVDSVSGAGGRSGKPVFTGATFVDRAAELGIDGDGAMEIGLVRVQFVLGEGWSAALRVFRPGTPTWTLV